ncbi:MAG: N-acetyltransferase, partial [Pseudomonadota bacterium]
VSCLCLTVRQPQGTLVGAIRFWPIRVGGNPTLLLGPLAVHPTHQGEGIGRSLILTGLNKARDRGWSRVLVIGDHLYYSRFGFFRVSKVECPSPTDSKRILGYDLTPGGWDRIDGAAEKWTF